MTGACLYLSHLQCLEVQSPGFLILFDNIQHSNLSALAVFLLHPKLAMAMLEAGQVLALLGTSRLNQFPILGERGCCSFGVPVRVPVSS